MNNMFNLFQMSNPQSILENMMKDERLMSNPMMKNAMEMARSGDNEGLSELVHNVGRQRGIDVDSIFNQFRQFR